MKNENNNIYYLSIIFIIIFIIFIYNNYYKKQNIINEKYANENKKSIEIIIARYNENLNWTLEYPFNQYKYTVYNKGFNDNFEKSRVEKIIELNNVGKCDHTYLYHIIENYNVLKDITVFLPGSIDLKYKKMKTKKLLDYIKKFDKAVFLSNSNKNIKNMFYNFVLNRYLTASKENRDENNYNNRDLKKSKFRPFGKWFDKHFGDVDVNCHTYWGIFSIDKRDIIQNPITWYEGLIKELSDHFSPEAGHFFERGWCAVFHPLNNTVVIHDFKGSK